MFGRCSSYTKAVYLVTYVRVIYIYIKHMWKLVDDYVTKLYAVPIMIGELLLFFSFLT